MSEPVEDTGRRLPCGRSVADLLKHLAEPAAGELADHVGACPYCRADLEVLDRRWEPVRRAAAAAVRPPAGLVERALATVREARRDHAGEPVELNQERGTLLVSATAALSLTRTACTEIVSAYRGARLHSCRGGVDGVTVDLVVAYPLPAPEIIDSVRSKLARRLRDYLGAATPSVRVRLADVDSPR